MKKFRDDDMDDFVPPKNLGYFVNTIPVSTYTVFLNEAIVSPVYYTDVVNMLYHASEHDTVIFNINSPGGQLNGLQSLLDAVMSTQASTIAMLVGECHSAASIFALHCDMVDVGPLATMLCHNVSYGYSGKGSDVLSHVQHVSKNSENLFRTTYKDFLSEQEINEVLAGKELYLDALEIAQRLEAREAAQVEKEEIPEVPEKKVAKSKK